MKSIIHRRVSTTLYLEMLFEKLIAVYSLSSTLRFTMYFLGEL